jgi:UDP-N-acetyl-D-galactosamine dehydrogenase
VNFKNQKIAIIGLGYVGLPLAIEFAKKYKVLGFDKDQSRIEELNSFKDRTKEVDLEDLKIVVNFAQKTEEKGLNFSYRVEDLKQCNVFIVTVPTPINKFNAPDLNPLIKASEMIGKALNKGDLVIYESTVYPGCTEEDCVPVLEKYSCLKFNKDFYCGYSPERINPGDKINTLTKIKKVTSGSTPEIAEIVDSLYKSIIEAGTHKAPSIKVAEASKAIENAQRDVNISFVERDEFIITIDDKDGQQFLRSSLTNYKIDWM